MLPYRHRAPRIMRRTLDQLYRVSGGVAAGLIALICLLVTVQVVFNLITKFGGTSVNLTIPSYADFAGYFLAASSFLALAYTLTRGGHIRVTLIIGKISGTKRLVAEVVALILAAAVAIFMTYFMIRLTLDSHRFGDLSPGIVAIPTWIPQSFVAVGLLILSVSLVDMLIQTVRRAAPVIGQHDSL